MKKKILIAVTFVWIILATLFLGFAIDRTMQPIMYGIDYIYEEEYTHDLGNETITVKYRQKIRFDKCGSVTIETESGKGQGLYMITEGNGSILKEDVNIYTMLPHAISHDQFNLSQNILGVSSDKQTIYSYGSNSVEFKTNINPLIIDWSLFGVFCVGIVVSIIFIIREVKTEREIYQ